MNQEVGGGGANTRQSKTARAKVHRNGTTTHAHSERQHQTSQLTLIVDNLI